MTQDLEQAAQQLAALSPQEALELIMKHQNARLWTADQEKDHALKHVRLSPDQWEEFRAYLLDGGGVDDAADLGGAFLTALFDGDQAVVFGEICHVVKHHLKMQLGRIRTHPGGGVTVNGAGPSLDLVKASLASLPTGCQVKGEIDAAV